MTEIIKAGVVIVTALIATKVFLRGRSRDSNGGVVPKIDQDASSSPSSSSSSSPSPSPSPSSSSSSPSPSTSTSSSSSSSSIITSSSSSSSSTSLSRKYDVFISFRGEETSKTFVDHLYYALEQHAVHTYKDDVTLDRGDTIGPALKSAIRESHISLIIFSENYADSSWCLDELSYIMKCKEEDSGKIVIPIFYNVDPSYVRKQKGQFGKAFAKHKSCKNNKNKVESWEKALVDASNISGWETEHVTNGHKARNIQPIVRYILGELSYSDSVIDDENLVGMDIVEKLKISYDSLDFDEKQIFLDIACFFRRKTIDEATNILEACGFYTTPALRVLIQMALISVSKDGKLDMHDMVQEMAYYIVRGEHPNNPEKHSRVWREEDIKVICSGNATMENDKIRAITCNSIVNSSNFNMFVSNLKKLRFLKVTTTSFDEGPSFLSNRLSYLEWDGCSASLPESFQPTTLVVLKMKRGFQKELWNGFKYLQRLKEMELSYIKALVRTPDIGGIPCLEKLILFGCDSLKEIHQSLGYHPSLVYVFVIHCQKLTRFPSIVRMDKLEILRISRCKALIEFPKIEAEMHNLKELYLDEVGIEVLPSSVGEYFTNLNSLKLEWCSKLKSIEGNFHALKCLKDFHVNVYNLGSKIGTSVLPHLPRSSLTKLDLSWCKLKDEEISSEIGELSNLRELHLRCNNFTRLDFSLSRLSLLKLLELSSCENLVELPVLPSSLAILKADWCESLEVIKDNAHGRCKWLCEVSIRGERKNITDGERLLKSMLQGKAVESGCMILQLKGLEIPRGFEPRVVRGGRCRMQLPKNWYDLYSGFLFCVVVDKDNYFDFRKITTRLKHEKLPGDLIRMRESQDYVYWEESVDDKYENTCMIYVSFGLLRNTSWWNQVSTAIELEIDGYRVSGCGSKLISKTSETTMITDSSSFDDVSDDYTCQLKILDDSKSALKFSIDR